MFDIKNIAKLARLEVDEAQAAPLEAQVRDILHYVETLQKVDTSAIQGYGLSETPTFWRLDEAKEPGTTREERVGLARSHQNGMFLVPKVIGEGDA